MEDSKVQNPLIGFSVQLHAVPVPMNSLFLGLCKGVHRTGFHRLQTVRDPFFSPSVYAWRRMLRQLFEECCQTVMGKHLIVFLCLIPTKGGRIGINGASLRVFFFLSHHVLGKDNTITIQIIIHSGHLPSNGHTDPPHYSVSHPVLAHELNSAVTSPHCLFTAILFFHVTSNFRK